MSNKDAYRDFCKKTPKLPLFFQDWWLDAVCGEDWDVVLHKSGPSIVAALPFYIQKTGMGSLIRMPKLTPFLGPFIIYPEEQKYSQRIGYEKKIMTHLIDNLPKTRMFDQNFSCEISNWQPFYWHGFQQTTSYTYVLENLENLEEVFQNFRGNVRTTIRKSEKIVDIEEVEDISLFYGLSIKTFGRQNKLIPYSRELVMNIDHACKTRTARKILIAKDQDQNCHAGIYLVWDQYECYYLMSGSDPQFRASGALNLLLWEGIQFASRLGLRFNFEGSMLESVEDHFRGFGAKQIPYFRVFRYQNCVFKWICEDGKPLIKKLLRK